MTKQEIIEQANINIERLIVSLLEKESQQKKIYCVNPEAQGNQTCDTECGICHKKYFEERKQLLRDIYYLKAE